MEQIDKWSYFNFLLEVENHHVPRIKVYIGTKLNYSIDDVITYIKQSRRTLGKNKWSGQRIIFFPVKVESSCKPLHRPVDRNKNTQGLQGLQGCHQNINVHRSALGIYVYSNQCTLILQLYGNVLKITMYITHVGFKEEIHSKHLLQRFFFHETYMQVSYISTGFHPFNPEWGDY